MLPGKGRNEDARAGAPQIVGGASVTEEIHPGFRCSTLAHSAGPMFPSIVSRARSQALWSGNDQSGNASSRAVA